MLMISYASPSGKHVYADLCRCASCNDPKIDAEGLAGGGGCRLFGVLTVGRVLRLEYRVF